MVDRIDFGYIFRKLQSTVPIEARRVSESFDLCRPFGVVFRSLGLCASVRTTTPVGGFLVGDPRTTHTEIWNCCRGAAEYRFHHQANRKLCTMLDTIALFIGPATWSFGIIVGMFSTLEAFVPRERRGAVQKWVAGIGDPAHRLRWQQSFIHDFDWCFSPRTLSGRRLFACTAGYFLIAVFFLCWFLWDELVPLSVVTTIPPVRLADAALPLPVFVLLSLLATFLSVAKSRHMTAAIAERESNAAYVFGALLDIALTLLLVLTLLAVAFAFWTDSANIVGFHTYITAGWYTLVDTVRALATGRSEQTREALFHGVFIIAPFVIAAWITFYATAGFLLGQIMRSGLFGRIGAVTGYFDEQEHTIRNLGIVMGVLVAAFVLGVGVVLKAY